MDDERQGDEVLRGLLTELRTERQVIGVKGALDRLVQWCAGQSGSKNADLSGAVWRWTKIAGDATCCLLHVVLVDWRACLTARERKALFDDLFNVWMSHLGLWIGLNSAAILPAELTYNQRQDIMDYLVELLRGFIGEENTASGSRFCGLIEDLLTLDDAGKLSKNLDSDALWSHVLMCIGTIPTRVFNVMSERAPLFVQNKEWTRRISLQCCLLLKKYSTSQAKPQLCVLVGKILGRLCRLGCPECAAAPIISLLESSTHKITLLPAVLEHVPDSELENITGALLLQSRETTNVSLTEALSQLRDRKHFKFLLVNKFTLVRVFPISVIKILCGVIMKCGFIPLSLEAILKAWSTSTFVTHCPLEQHAYINFLLLEIMQLALESEVTARIALILEGIQVHMYNSTSEIKIMGLKVAEALSIIMHKPITFSELHREKESASKPPSSESSTVNTPLEPTNSPVSKPSADNHEKPKHKKLIEVDPDEVVNLSDPEYESEEEDGPAEEDQGKLCSNGDEFQPYDLTDDKSDLAPFKTPKYIRQAYALLQEHSDDLDATLAALKSIIAISKEKPHALVELAEKLTMAVLHVSNKWSCPEIKPLRNQALLSLAVMCPDVTPGVLVSLFYNSSSTNYDREIILTTLSDAADQLSGSQKKEAQSAPQAPPRPLIEEVVHDNKLPTEMIIGQSTRRWHKKPSTPPVIIHNQLLPIVHQIFYPMLQNYDKHIPTLDLLSEGALLSHFTLVMGNILCNSENSPSFVHMCLCMLDFLYAIHRHKEPSVRRCILVTLHRILCLCSPRVIATELSRKLGPFEPWLQDVTNPTTGDPDPDCCFFATKVLGVLEAKLHVLVRAPDTDSL
ncbi:telomere length regulation protein TEL2 [Pelomyxa schiedti]|nr:telomere length regulation protein TEL2 [Pelomyxa schiedti]